MLSMVFQASPVPMAIASLDDGRLIDFNEQFIQFTEYAREELIGRKVLELNLWLHAEDRQRIIDEILQRQRKISGHPVSLRTKSGKTRDVLFSADIVDIENTPCLLSSALDITEHKQLDESLKKSEADYRRLFENSLMGICEATPDGSLIRLNRAFANMYGYGSPEQVMAEVSDIGKQLYANPKDRDEFLRILDEEGRVEPKEIPMVRRDGSRFYVLLSAQAVRDPSGKLAFLQATHMDITDRKSAEMNLLKAEENYRGIFETAQEGVYRTTPEGKFEIVNPAMARILGYDSPGELVAGITDISRQLYVHPEKRNELMKIIEQQNYADNFEIEFYKKDRSQIWVSLNLHAVRNANGEILNLEGIMQDITDRRESLNRMRQALTATVHAMAVTVETRDPYTSGHQKRTADLARAIAAEIHLSSERIEGMRMAGIIHDLGKLSVPAEILSMPRKLTEMEFALIKTHPEAGYDILKNIDFPWPIARMVLEHHERMDGSGYPNGLTGEKLLKESRILMVADVVEAMSSHRPFRPSLGLNAALDEISRNSGVLYDEEAVDACLRLFHEKGYRLIE